MFCDPSGEVAEWSKARAWKVRVRKRTKSSNLFLSVKSPQRWGLFFLPYSTISRT